MALVVNTVQDIPEMGVENIIEIGDKKYGYQFVFAREGTEGFEEIESHFEEVSEHG